MGFKYDKDISKMGKDKFGKHYKGGFEGCFYKDFIEYFFRFFKESVLFFAS